MDSKLEQRCIWKYLAEMSDQSNFVNNEHIIDFLNYYTALSAPDYAVLLTGKWGIGKTFFINKYIEQFFHEQSKKYRKIRNIEKIRILYNISLTRWFINKFLSKNKYIVAPQIIKISLNGVQTKNEINNKILHKIIPIINNKSITSIKKILHPLLKINFLDFSKLNAHDLFDIYYPDSIYIFDDLERASMPIETVLGHINTFVETRHCKVIIIGNEEELISKEENYKIIKEKVIGKTLQMIPETKNAIQYFFNQISNKDARNFLYSHQELIIRIYKQSQLNNLRILHHTLKDFERLYDFLEDKHKQHEEFGKDIIKLFFILSFEIKAGHFSCTYLNTWRTTSIRTLLNKKIENNQKDYFEKYDEELKKPLMYNNIFTDKMLTHILEEGFFSKGSIKHELNDLPAYFPSQEAWKNLKFWTVHKSEKLDSMLEQFEQDFRERKYSIKLMLSIFDLRLYFAKNGVLNLTVEEVEEECMQYIDEVVLSTPNEKIDIKKSFYININETGLFFHPQESLERLQCHLADMYSKRVNNKFKDLLKGSLLSNTESKELINNLNDYNFKDLCIFEIFDIPTICHYLINNSYSAGIHLFQIAMGRFYREDTNTKKREWEYCKSIRDNLLSIQNNFSKWEKLKIKTYIWYINNEVSKYIGEESNN